MSNRTIVEINHDFWAKIKNDPEKFSALLLEYIRSLSHNAKDELRGFGCNTLATIHHTDEVSISFRHKP